MPFSLGGITFSRGTKNSYAGPDGIITHYYKSKTDTISIIETSGYFPAFFSGTKENVNIGDLFVIKDSLDNHESYKVTSLEPALIEKENLTNNPFDQSLNTTNNVTFNSTSLTANASNPGGTNTLWVNSGDLHVYRGSVDLEDSGGDVFGPASSTNNAIVRFDAVTGKLIKNSDVLIDDNDNVTIPQTKSIAVDNILESTPANGVSIDGGRLTVSSSGVLSTVPIGTDAIADNGAGFITVLNELRADDIRSSVQGYVNFGQPIRLPSSGGVAASLDHYEELTKAMTTTTALSVDQNVTVKAVRIGDKVTIDFTTFTGTNNVSSSLEIGASGGANTIPTSFRPASDKFLGFGSADLGGVDIFYSVWVNANGILELFYSPSGGKASFPGLNGVLQIREFSGSYLIF